MLKYVYNLKIKKLCFLVIIYIFCHIIFKVLLSLNARHIDTPVLVWWTEFSHIKNDRLITCFHDAYKCLITTNRTINTDLAAYLFYGSRIENHDFPLPRDYNTPWAIFHEESPKNYAPLLYPETQNIFNLTSTFSRYSDFPVTLQYLQDVALITDSKYYIPVDIKNKYLDDIAPVLYIQSDCDTPLNRDHFVKDLGKHVKIDSYGKCLRNKKFTKELSEVYSLDIYNEELLRFISKYKFIISFENSICDDYITEKLWRSLIVGSIPIYLGSPTIEDWLPNENSAILVRNYDNFKDVADVINKINNNNTLYQSFLEHKLKSKVSNSFLDKMLLQDHPIPAFECFVCKEIHEPNHIYKSKNKDLNVYKCPKPKNVAEGNTWYQHWEIGKCQSKALEILLAKNEPYSSTLFEETWKNLLYSKNC